MRRLLLFLLLLLAGCGSAFDREIRIEPATPHNLAADKTACRDYAELYGFIDPSPIMGDGAKPQPDRQRQNRLFVVCMEEKGYGF